MPEKKNINKSIFVSSTFRDMQAERDALRDFVLPLVNEFAAQYGHAVEIIDLRWGVDTASVSSEVEQSRKVLRTCLDEIERSRPLFLGLIGDRYGWTPPLLDMEVALDAAQFSLEDINMSVTALEIEYGVLRSEKKPICLFYFRKSLDYSVLPEELHHIYQDGEEGYTKLEKLKKEIRMRFGLDVKDYTAEIHENKIAVSKDWANMVAEDIKTKLRDEWGKPTETPQDWKKQERDMQEAFRESRTVHFAGRTLAIKDMVDFCLDEESTPKIVMMQGQAGSGKSGLMCRVMDEIKDKCLLLPFCCGVSPNSVSIEKMLKYFTSILCERLSKEDDSDTIMGYRERFRELLNTACKKMRVVLVVDALDQFVESDEARQMLWINGKLPENFRLLCSIIDGPETEAVKLLGGEVRSVPPISIEDKAAIIRGIATRHRKQIGNAVVEHIQQKQTPNGTQAAQNPLYLSLIVQDLVMLDRYELDTVHKYMEEGMSQPEALAKFMIKRIDETPGDAEGAYLAILNRLEKLIGRNFVRGVCGMIAVSYNGLEQIVLDLAFKELGMDFNPADFSWLRQMLREHISQREIPQESGSYPSGVLWDFSHQCLRRALRKNYPDELKRLNKGIIIAFQKIPKKAFKDYSYREEMYHLCMDTFLKDENSIEDAKKFILSILDERKKVPDISNYHFARSEENRNYLYEALARFNEQKHWHPKRANHVADTGARDGYISVWKFECCATQVIADFEPSQFRGDGCEIYKGK